MINLKVPLMELAINTGFPNLPRNSFTNLLKISETKFRSILKYEIKVRIYISSLLGEEEP